MFSTIRAKLFVIVSLGVAALVAIAAFALYNAITLQKEMVASVGNMAAVTEAVDAARGAQVRFAGQVQEWKDILLRGQDREAFEHHFQGFEAREKDVAALLGTLKARLGDLGFAARIDVDARAKVMAGLGARYRDALKQYRQGDESSAHKVDQLVRGMDREPSAAITKTVEEIQKLAEEIRGRELADAQARYASMRNSLIGGVLSIALLLILCAGLVSRSIRQQVNALRQTVSGITASNDLTMRAAAHGKHEIGSIATSLNIMLERFQETIAGARDSALSVDASARELAASSEELSETASRQSEATMSSAAAIEQLTVAITSVSDGASEVQNQAQSSVASAKSGQEKVQALIDEILCVEAAVKDIASSVDQFVSATGTISMMTRQVQELASRTNLLALNAAIEAARAGEQGRGFAVVADEVRQLAERSSKAAQEIDALTNTINTQSVAVKKAVGAGLASLEHSNTITSDVELSIGAARKSVERAAASVGEMTVSFREEKTASTEIAQAMERISQMSEEATAISRATKGTSELLAKLAAGLIGSINQFKVA
jgi:methyl-accepting chemotaxis protein